MNRRALRQLLLRGAILTALLSAPVIRAAHEGAPFPQPDWPQAANPGRWGFTPERIAAYSAWLRQHAGSAWACVVIKDGWLVYTGAGPHSSIHQVNDCGSIEKSLQGTVLGAALLQGRLKSIDEDALTYWKHPFRTPYANDRTITFRQFATYRDRWNEPPPPGTYAYNNASATAAGACIAGLYQPVSGPIPSGIDQVARRVVMDVIHARWDLSCLDAPFVAGNASIPGPQFVFRSSVYELAKLGYLWLQQGDWAGHRIFSAPYYHDAVTDWSPDTGTTAFARCGHFGYWWFVNDGHFWLPHAPADTFYAIGDGEPKRATTLMIMPGLRLVAVLSMTRRSDDGHWDVIKNGRVPRNDGPRRWSDQLMKLQGRPIR